MCSPSYPRLPALADKLACHPLFKMCQIKKPIMAADDMLKLRLQTRASQSCLHLSHHISVCGINLTLSKKANIHFSENAKLLF